MVFNRDYGEMFCYKIYMLERFYEVIGINFYRGLVKVLNIYGRCLFFCDFDFRGGFILLK